MVRFRAGYPTYIGADAVSEDDASWSVAPAEGDRRRRRLGLRAREGDAGGLADSSETAFARREVVGFFGVDPDRLFFVRGAALDLRAVARASFFFAASARVGQSGLIQSVHGGRHASIAVTTGARHTGHGGWSFSSFPRCGSG